MKWKSHIAIGCIIAALLFVFVYPVSDTLRFLSLILFAGISALAPDLDNGESKGKKVLDICFMLVSLSYLYYSSCGYNLCIPSLAVITNIIIISLALIGIYFLLFRFFKPRHRGITHTFLAAFLYGILIFVLTDVLFAIAALVGYFSHLAADRHIRLY